jgi:glyoxylase-like metal-dependent hydrolase (beta-lactamase superfamily II)
MRNAFLWPLAAMLAALPMQAHPKHRPAPTKADEQAIHRVEKLTEHAYVIFGQGGNVGLFVTDDYALLVDDQFEAIAPGLLKAVRSVTPKPIRYLVNTHAHPDHVGANVVLEKQVMAIVAHANVRKRMVLAQAKLEPSKRGGLPELAFGEEDPNVRARLDIHLGGADFHLLHMGPGHTDGDIILGYPAERVMHMGDLFFNGILPYVDGESGGSFDGLVAQVDHVAGWIPDDARIIPGHGPVASKKDLQRYRDLLKAVQAHVKAHPGQAPAALAAGFDTQAWPDYKAMPGFVSWESLFAVASGQGPGRVAKP